MKKSAPFSILEPLALMLVISVAVTSFSAHGCWGQIGRLANYLLGGDQKPFYQIEAPLPEGAETFLKSLSWETYKEKRLRYYLGLQTYLLENGSRPSITFVGRNDGLAIFNFYHELTHLDLRKDFVALHGNVDPGLTIFPYRFVDQVSGESTQISSLLQFATRFTELLDQRGKAMSLPTPVPFPVIESNASVQAVETGNPYQTPRHY